MTTTASFPCVVFGGRSAVFGLELISYRDHYVASLHALETPEWTEDERVFDVHGVEVLSQQVPWVVVSGGTADKYHFPDPQAAAYGEAKPVQLQPVRCPDCSKFICQGILQRVEPAAVDGLSITCPRCEYDAVVDVALDGGLADANDVATESWG
ncbi:hypothetical protein [Haloarcula sp. JP-L23]|uniref:hypothetical protein n=1 Tax=Haloarcula sp. JP-L23 TaxID=2716717 RepID=UPI0018783139